MAKPKIPNQKTKYNALNKRLSDYVALVRKIYDALNLEAAKMAERVHYSGEKPFRFGDYPQLRDSVLKLKNRFSTDMQALIYSGTSREWKESNLVQDLVADKVLKAYGATVRGEKYKIYYQPNSDALKAFQTRKDNGLTLSQKLWNQATNYREELEYAISSAIQKGTSAVTLSKRISKYLQDFDLLQKDYKQKYGKAVTCYDCEYRSIRLARSEINMAYRTAEQKRWEQMDFVVGYEIKLSHAHHHRMPHGDICDELAGKYPKDFKWTGWHPNDMCYVVPILKTEEEFWADEDVTSKNEITDTPKQFKDWISDNKERIKKAKSRGTLPYFVKDNQQYIILNNERKEFSISDKDYLVSMGFRFKGSSENIVDEYNKSSIRGFDLKSFDAFIESLCDTNGIRLRNKSLTIFENGNVELSYIGRSKDNDTFVLARSFVEKENKRTVIHNNFVMPESLQGKGSSKEVMRESFKQYESMGIDTIQIYANLKVGGYTWAKYGFSAIKEDVKFIIDNALKDSIINQQDYNSLKSLIDKYETIFPMNLIANMAHGKDILLGSWWNGIFEMKDKKQLVYLKDYIGF